MAEEINREFKKDYKEFLRDYVLPLLGLSITDDEFITRWSRRTTANKSVIVQNNGQLHFFVSNHLIYSVPCAMQIPEDDLALAKRILQSYPDIAQYKITGTSRFLPLEFPYHKLKKALYTATVQNGISSWLAGDKKKDRVGELFDALETWAVKTYEGKNVTMGFIINPEEESKFLVDKRRWLDFMSDDTVAMLTDCIHSVIELDAQCNFLAYHSLSEKNRISAYSLSHKVPLRFSQMIQTYVVSKKRGVFLLNNGDIVLAKEQEVRFVRRNLRWLNLSYSAFRNAIQPFVEHSKVNSSRIEKLIESIFASVLDVSFSHTGGIIAIVGGKWSGSVAKKGSDEKPILAECDDLFNSEYEKAEHVHDIRPLKRAILKELIQDKTFDRLDRKLRGELLGLDGACILNYAGKVQSIGAIIQNDSGSTGGSRAAAAKKLSEFGMAVKISTDGYIEVYIKGNLVYSIK